MSKYTILLGRGIEGTGNTKYSVELAKYLTKRGDYVVSIATSDKKWGRTKSHNHGIAEYKISKQYDKFVEAIDDANTLLVMSVPADNYDTLVKDNFMNLIKEAKAQGITIVYIQVDHRIHSINRNFYADSAYFEFFDLLDSVVTHTKEGDFYKFLTKRELRTNNIKVVEGGINGYDFTNAKSQWVAFEDKEYKTIRFLGRSVPWKGPWHVRDIHNNVLRQHGYKTILEGIEMSIQTVSQLYQNSTGVKIPRTDVNIQIDKEYNYSIIDRIADSPAIITGPYVNAEGMARLRASMFGIELLHLPDAFLSSIMEYAMIEYVACGTVPIFRTEWAKRFKLGGKTIYEWGQEATGTIFMDDEDQTKAIELMNKLANNKELYDKYRNNAFDFYSTHLNLDTVYDKVLEAAYN